MDGSTQTIRMDHLAWAAKLTAYPIGTTDPRTGLPSTGKNQADQIPALTPAQLKQIQATETEYEGLVNDDRANDAKGVLTP